MQMTKQSLSVVIIVFLLSILVKQELSSQITSTNYEYGGRKIIDADKYFVMGFTKQTSNQINSIYKEFPNTPAIQYTEMLEVDNDLQSNNFKLAEKRLSVFVDKNVNSPFRSLAAFKAGTINYDRGNKVRAEYFFELARKLAEDDLKTRQNKVYAEIANQSLYWNAASKVAQNKYSDAKPLLEESAKNYSQESYADDAIYALGLIAEIENDFDQAIAYFKKVRINYPRSNTYLSSLIREANNNLLLRNYQPALINLEKAEIIINQINNNQSELEVQSHADYARQEILYLRGEANNQAGNFDKAISYFTTFLETYSEDELAGYVRLGAGWAMLNMKRYDNALKYYDYIIANEGERNPKSRSYAQLYRAVTLKRMGNLEQAKKEFAALSMQSSYTFQGQVLLELGQIYYEEEDFQSARKVLERAEREATDPFINVRIMTLLGATYMELEFWDKALLRYSKAEKQAENTPIYYLPQKKWFIAESRLKQGIILVNLSRSSEAISTLSSYLAESESELRKEEAMFWLAESYYRSDMLQNAQTIYENILQSYPNSNRKEEILYGLGWSYFRKQDFTNSSKTFERLVAEYPKSKYSVEVFARQGDGYYLIKNYSLAAEAYRKAAKLSPKSEDGQYSAYQMCHALYRLNKYDESVTALLDFVRSYNKSTYAPNALYLIGWIRFRQKRYSEAIDNYKYLLEAYPQSIYIPRTHYAIADAYYNMGNYEKASEEYKIVIENYPTSDLAPESMKGVQQCLILLGREDEVIETIDSYSQKHSDSPFVREFQTKKASILFDNRKYSDAITEYQNIIAKNPSNQDNAEALYWIGKSFVSMNNPIEAEKSFDEVKSKYPSSEYAGLALLENGLLQKKINNINKSDSIFLVLMKEYPQHQASPQAGFERAIMKYGIGDTLSAVNIYYQVANLYSETEYAVESRIRVAIYLRNKGLSDSARKEFEILASQNIL